MWTSETTLKRLTRLGMALLLAGIQLFPVSEIAEARTRRTQISSGDGDTEGYFDPADLFSDSDLPWSNPDRPDYYGAWERQAERRRPKVVRCLKCEKRSRAKNVVIESRYQAQEIRRSVAPSNFMSRIANAAVRFGRAERGYCYRGVKRIIAAVDPSLAKYFNGSRLAINAMTDLRRAGFRNDMNSCWRPGVVRVYKGPASGMGKAAAQRFMRSHFGINGTAGDYAGHIEVLGSDHRWHHFTSSAAPIDHPMHFGPQRRRLVGCFVK